jgi:hypothetical protein
VGFAVARSWVEAGDFFWASAVVDLEAASEAQKKSPLVGREVEEDAWQRELDPCEGEILEVRSVGAVFVVRQASQRGGSHEKVERV